jgi:hypothetical protein
VSRLVLSLWFVCGCASAVAENGDGAIADAPRLDAFVQLDAPGHDADLHDDAAVPADAKMIDAAPDAHETSCATPFTGTLATWSLAGQPGSQSSTAVSSTATGVTAGALARSAALTAVSGSGSINSSGWTTSSGRDGSEYYTLTVSPPSGCQLDLTSISIDTKSSSTGPASAEVSTSADNFASEASVTTNAVSSPSLTATDQTAPVEVRIYGFAASSAQGTFRVENTFTVTGSLH